MRNANHLATVTIGDFIGPETLAQLSIAEEIDDGEFCSIEQAGYIMGEAMSQWDCWKTLWLYGIIVDDDMNYYVPNDYDTEVALLPQGELA
jgi:hypothetical protein